MRQIAKAGIGLVWIGTTALNILLLPDRYAVRAGVEISRKSTLPLMVRAAGTVEPKHTLVFKAEFEGPVISKLYKEGDRVPKGKLLLEIGRDGVRLEHDKKAIALENAK